MTDSETQSLLKEAQMARQQLERDIKLASTTCEALQNRIDKDQLKKATALAKELAARAKEIRHILKGLRKVEAHLKQG